VAAPESKFRRIERLPPYVFNIVNELKAAARARGEDIIDFGMGNPDQPTPQHIVDKLCEAAERRDTHRYSVSRGIPRLRRAIARWYQDRYGVELDPDTEAIVTIGSKEGLAHLALATMGAGDTVLVPNPAYPIHPYGFIIAGADVRHVRMTPDVDFFEELQRSILDSWPRPKMLVLNFPGNPTTECVDLAFFEKVVEIAREHGIWVVHDLAYADIVFDGYRAPSILQVAGAKEIAVEFFSMSKSYNMPGWRIGFMCGCPTLIAALARIKSYLDYGTFTPIQVAAIHALESSQQCVADIRAMYQRRRDCLCDGLAGRAPEGDDVRLGADPAALPRCLPRAKGRRRDRFDVARALQAAPAEGEGRGRAGYRLRRVRRRSCALQSDRERAAYAPGGAGHQADVPRGRAGRYARVPACVRAPLAIAASAGLAESRPWDRSRREAKSAMSARFVFKRSGA
jgi:alanine-synthesizing transaminase